MSNEMIWTMALHCVTTSANFYLFERCKVRYIKTIYLASIVTGLLVFCAFAGGQQMHELSLRVPSMLHLISLFFALILSIISNKGSE